MEKIQGSICFDISFTKISECEIFLIQLFNYEFCYVQPAIEIRYSKAIMFKV